MRVVSVPGRLVRDPATHRIVDEIGIDIDPTNPTWARYLADGDVAEAKAGGKAKGKDQPAGDPPADLPSDVKD